MSISIDTLKQAISLKELIAALESRLEKILGGGDVPAPFSAPVKKGRKTMSAAARAKIAAAQRARWAKAKGTSPAAAVVKPTKSGKRKLSPEGRARIVAALKKRWALKRKK